MSSAFQAFYATGRELQRHASGLGLLERERMRTLFPRYLPPAPATLLDIGGAHGAHAFWLAEQGYAVHLLDLVEAHVEAARLADGGRLTSLRVGDARALPYPDGFADAALLAGPLYHLTDRTDRLQALQEAHRCLNPGGRLLAVGISASASLMVGCVNGWVLDADYRAMCSQEVQTGEHRRPPTWPQLFPDGHFHRPEALSAELEDAGFEVETVLGIQGPGWLLPEFGAQVQTPEGLTVLLEVAAMTETDPLQSPHLLAVGRRR
ncbi:class I SAM-dependent methyltransferase [Deinococcus aquiradiocola]|uniref:class I SAM-dependent methyltransferase n=1 Tax=Deinococcus aquiradiocola TaxID=393059 RepID=UPI001668D74A|nr:class I SAM-dependent methyltransferase [Deinococcus aquiradiocola]